MGSLQRVSIFVAVLMVVAVGVSLLPFAANPAIRQANALLGLSLSYPARLIYQYFHLLGNGAASNNLGVLYLRGMGARRDRDGARALFETAAAKGVQAARYNLVLTMENRHKTADNIIKRQLALLDQNVALGDIPSHVLLARRLGFTNRDQFVPNREARKLELLETAAETGDADYIFQLGQELEVQAFVQEDPYMMIKALQAYRQVYDLGHMEGAEMLAAARHIRWNITPSRAEILEKSEDEWTLIAANAGRIAPKCRYGLIYFDRLPSLKQLTEDSDEAEWQIERFRATDDVELAKLSVSFLEACAPAKRVKFGPNRPFGDVALYARKMRSGAIALVNSPPRARLALGKLYAFGIHVKKSKAEAIKHFRLLRRSDRARASAWIKYLNATPGE